MSTTRHRTSTAVTMTVDTARGPEPITGRRLDRPGYAWTPNDWQNTAPDIDMVRVQWDRDTQPMWEYISDLTPAGTR